MKRLVLFALSLGALSAASAQTVVYRCPNNVYTSSADISQKQAEERGCKVLEGAPVTVVQGNPPRPAAARAPGAGQPVPSRPDARIDPGEQRARDNDARRILESELKREEERLAALKTEFNNGEPERRGDEKNYQKYLDRVAELKAGIARKESDIAALRRELSKLPPS